MFPEFRLNASSCSCLMNCTCSKSQALICTVYGVSLASDDPALSTLPDERLNKYDYKCDIKQAADDYETVNANEVSDHLLNKHTTIC